MDPVAQEQGQAPALGAEIASGAGDDANASQPSPTAENTGQQDGQGQGEDIVPRSVMEAQLEAQNRHWQSVIDKRFASMEQKFQQSATPPQPLPASVQPQAQPTQDDFDNEKFMSMLDEDPAKARQYFFQHNATPSQNPQDIQSAVSTAVQQALVSQQQQEQQMAQFVSAMNAATDGLTSEEKVRAEQYAVGSYQQTGQYVDPYMAAMVGRFGSVEQALKMANAQMMALGQAGPVSDAQPAPDASKPPVTSGPGLVGGGIGQNPQPTGDQPSAIQPGSFRQLLR